MEMMKPGMTWESAYRRAVQMAEEFGYGEEFMGFGPEKVRFSRARDRIGTAMSRRLSLGKWNNNWKKTWWLR